MGRYYGQILWADIMGKYHGRCPWLLDVALTGLGDFYFGCNFYFFGAQLIAEFVGVAHGCWMSPLQGLGVFISGCIFIFLVLNLWQNSIGVAHGCWISPLQGLRVFILGSMLLIFSELKIYHFPKCCLGFKINIK